MTHPLFVRLTACLFVLGLVSAATLPARAEGGVAFALSPEQAYAEAFADTLPSALGRAMQACENDGGEDCFLAAFCAPAGWSGWLGIMLESGFHYSHPICGAQSRDVLIAMMTAACEAGEYVTECYIGIVFDPDGQEESPDISITP